MVVQLLVLGGIVSEQGPAGDHQVRTGGIEAFVDQEILLLPAQVRIDFCHTGVEVLADGDSRVADGLEGLLERGLVVQGLAGIGNKDSRNAKCVVQDEDRRGRIPRGIAAGFEGGPDTAAREGRGVRLLLGKHLAVKGFDHAAFPVIVDQGVMLFGGTLGQGLEPVGDVRDTVFDRPFFHAAGDTVRRLAVERFAAFDTVKQRMETFHIQILAHLLPVEDQFSIVIGGFACRNRGRNFLLHEGLLD